MTQLNQPPTLNAPAADGASMRAMIDRAEDYLRGGSFPAAIELLRGVLEAGYSGPDARVQLAEALAGRGEADEARVLLDDVVDDPEWGRRATSVLARLDALDTAGDGTWRTETLDTTSQPYAPQEAPTVAERHDIGRLPLTSRLEDSALPAHVQRVLREADAEIAKGRLVSAMDLTLHAETLASESLALRLRRAELLAAAGRNADAVCLAETVGRLAGLRDDPRFRLPLMRIVAHADPTTDHLLELVDLVLSEDAGELISQYLPTAISALARSGDGQGARALATQWRTTQPRSTEARYYQVRELLRAGNVEEAATFAADGADDLWLAGTALGVTAASADNAQWSVADQVSHAIAVGRFQRSAFAGLIADLSEVMPAITVFDLHRALLALATGDYLDVVQWLRSFQPSGNVEAFIASVCLARAAMALDDEASRVAALKRAYALVREPDVAQIIETVSLFDPPASETSIGNELAMLLNQRGDAAGAARIYTELLETFPEDADIVRAQAEALARVGQRADALERLTRLLQHQEQNGAGAATIETLRTMIQIAPGSTQLRRRLADRYIQRGCIEEGLGELFTLAQLLARRNLVSDATVQLQRAAEIATLTGDWAKVTHIYTYMTRLQPEDIGLRHAAAATFIQHGHIAEAVGQLQEVVRISMVAEDADEAIAALHQIIALTPDDPAPYHHLGELLASVGEFGQAERVYRRLTSLLPDDPAVRAKQEALAALARGTS